MIKENRVAQYTGEKRMSGRKRREREWEDEKSNRSFSRSAPISMQKIQPFFLPATPFFSLFSFFTSVPLSTDLIARQKGRPAYVVICTLLYTRSITTLTSFVPSSQKFYAEVQAYRRHNSGLYEWASPMILCLEISAFDLWVAQYIINHLTIYN